MIYVKDMKLIVFDYAWFRDLRLSPRVLNVLRVEGFKRLRSSYLFFSKPELFPQVRLSFHRILQVSK